MSIDISPEACARFVKTFGTWPGEARDAHSLAADMVAALSARVAALEGALDPFAAFAEDACEEWLADDATVFIRIKDHVQTSRRIKDFRRARAVLRGDAT